MSECKRGIGHTTAHERDPIRSDTAIEGCRLGRRMSYLLAASDSPSPLAEHRESISSMKMMLGALSLAMLKRLATSFSLSPSHLLTKSLEDTEKKVESASVATALAK